MKLAAQHTLRYLDTLADRIKQGKEFDVIILHKVDDPNFGMSVTTPDGLSHDTIIAACKCAIQRHKMLRDAVPLDV